VAKGVATRGGDDGGDDDGGDDDGGDEEKDEDEVGDGDAPRKGEVGASVRAEAETDAASPRAAIHSPRLGAWASIAQESLWRSVATCESQQGTEQKTSCVRARLQVDTLQTQWIAPNPMSFRQALQ
jgi:hypothetical protein